MNLRALLQIKPRLVINHSLDLSLTTALSHRQHHLQGRLLNPLPLPLTTTLHLHLLSELPQLWLQLHRMLNHSSKGPHRPWGICAKNRLCKPILCTLSHRRSRRPLATGLVAFHVRASHMHQNPTSLKQRKKNSNQKLLFKPPAGGVTTTNRTQRRLLLPLHSCRWMNPLFKPARMASSR